MAAADPAAEPEDAPSYYFDIAALLDTLIFTPSYTNLIPNLPSLHPYTNLAPPAKVLYIRLYLRKRTWLKSETLKYKEVPDVQTSLGELTGAGLLLRIGDDTDNMTVSDLLETFSATKLKELCKSLNLQTKGTLNLMKESVLKMCKTQRSLFGGSTSQRVKKKCCELMDDMVKVAETPATILDKVLIASFPQHLLFSEKDDEVGLTGQKTLSTIMLPQFKVTRNFPSYKVSHTKPLFSSSHQLETFLAACQLEAQCNVYTDKHDWSTIEKMYTDTLPRFKVIVNLWKGTRETPADSHLIRFTEEYVVARIMRKCLAALQRLKKYEEAVKLLKLLLRYKPMSHKRGSWWENQALILHFHLKNKDSALKVATKGLADPNTGLESRIALEIRMRKLDKNYTPKFTFEPKEITIDIVAFKGSGSAANSKKIWLGDDNGESVLCGVEDVTLNYYINNFNFKEGFHCEGGILSTLFAIFCWDLLFCDVENVFYNEYQYCPLDLWSKEFYPNRKDKIVAHFDFLRELSEEGISDIVAQTWDLHYGTGCDGLNWELFADVKQCQRCVTCITPPKLVKLLEEYVPDIRGKRSGIPDLSLWNHETREFAMVEVKGPGDSLSNKQKVWLSRLDEFGIRAELCLVKAAKQLG